MDLYCQRCGEPWDVDSVNFEMAPTERVAFKAGEHCPSCVNKHVEKRPLRAQLAGFMADAMGEDLDGIAAEMDDAEALLGSDFWE